MKIHQLVQRTKLKDTRNTRETIHRIHARVHDIIVAIGLKLNKSNSHEFLQFIQNFFVDRDD